MFEQLRKIYPEASVICDVISASYGHYVIRCLVKNEKVAIGSGLGSGITVEEAEDKARQRALDTLAFSADQENIIKKQKEDFYKEKIEEDLKKQFLGSEIKKVDHSDIFSQTFSTNWLESSIQETATKEIDDIPFSSGLEIEQDLEETQEEITTPVEIPAFDFSEVIAKTNRELKRLAWTNQQGRDYLLATYDKRSRQLLTDEQLIEFLGYLESLPSDNDPVDLPY